MRIAGVDGARIAKVSGWLVAVGEGPLPTRLQFVSAAEEIVGLADLVAIDVPIGLPAEGKRQCDLLARARMAGRGSVVFPVPPRSVVNQPTVAAVYDQARALGGPLPTPFFMGIRPRILEVDALLRTHDPKLNWFEVHPEVSFACMNGEPITVSKHTALGLELRREALHAAMPGLSIAALLAELTETSVKLDDVLDALAAYWTAFRIAIGYAETLPATTEHDEFGLRMAIWA